MIRIALAQINTIVGDLQGNQEKIIKYISKAKEAGADLVVFPELSISGYPPEDLLHKEQFIKDNIKAVRSLSKKVSSIISVVGFVSVDEKKKIYNSAGVIADKQIKGIYSKHDLPNYGVFDEKRYFSEGKENPVFVIDKTPFSVSICEDFWNDSGVFLNQVNAGSEILINISASPYDFGKLQQRKELLVSKAKESNAYVCYVNLVGGQDELVFDGGSLVIDPKGKIIASGKQFEEDLIIADLELERKHTKKIFKKYIEVSVKKNKKKKSIESHLSENYCQFERVYRALVLGTRDYVEKNGFSKVVLGISGGIDSALVSAIAREAVGKENVIGISMPSPFTSKGTKTDAKKLAENLGIRFIEMPINEIFNSYLGMFKQHFDKKKKSVAEENLQARIRGNILMTFSNKFGWLVLTTGNKSEIAVGYCTLYGDMTGGFAVIKDVPKTLVYDIAKFINTRDGMLIPESIIKRAPTAELCRNQKDEDSLPRYDILDPILKAYVEDLQPFSKIARKSRSPELVKEIIKMVDCSEYKRRQAPPGVKITQRAFGKDWRLPITNKYEPY